jgi:hypothetical protein
MQKNIKKIFILIFEFIFGFLLNLINILIRFEIFVKN